MSIIDDLNKIDAIIRSETQEEVIMPVPWTYKDPVIQEVLDHYHDNEYLGG